MSWMTRKLDNLGSAGCGAAGGISLSQAPAFTQAYLQRLGGHIDEARRTVEGVADGSILPWLQGGERSEAVIELNARVTELEQIQSSLLNSPSLMRPLALLRQADWSIADRAFDEFVPAIPLDPASLLWTGLGVVVALVIYELFKAPAALIRRRPKYGNP